MDSSTPVSGDNLAKLIIKAICLLENHVALIHGVIVDGASTNRRMWKLLNIDTDIDNLNNHFVHPLDESRKVFMFSDAPHLIKCIRNKLFNTGYMKVCEYKFPRFFEQHFFQINEEDGYIK